MDDLNLMPGMITLILHLLALLSIAEHTEGMELEPTGDIAGYKSQDPVILTFSTEPLTLPTFPRSPSQSTEPPMPFGYLASSAPELHASLVSHSMHVTSSPCAEASTITCSTLSLQEQISDSVTKHQLEFKAITDEKILIPSSTGMYVWLAHSTRIESIPQFPRSHVMDNETTSVRPTSNTYTFVSMTIPSNKRTFQQMLSGYMESSTTAQNYGFSAKQNTMFQHNVQSSKYDEAPSYLVAYPLSDIEGTAQLELSETTNVNLPTLAEYATNPSHISSDTSYYVLDDKPILLPCPGRQEFSPSHEFLITFNATEKNLSEVVHQLESLLSHFFNETTCTTVRRSTFIIGPPHVFGWSNVSISGLQCKRELINMLFAEMALASGQPRPIFAAYFSPWISIVAARKLYEGVCSPYGILNSSLNVAIIMGSVLVIILIFMCIAFVVLARHRQSGEMRKGKPINDLKGRTPLVLLSETQVTAESSKPLSYSNLAFSEVPATDPPPYMRMPSDTVSDANKSNGSVGTSSGVSSLSSSASHVRIDNSVGTMSV